MSGFFCNSQLDLLRAATIAQLHIWVIIIRMCRGPYHEIFRYLALLTYGDRHMQKMIIQVNLDMTDSMGPGKLVRHMQNPSYTYD